MKYSLLPAALFQVNRKRFVSEMESRSLAIFNSNDEMPSNGDASYKFEQNSDLFWLTGIAQEDTMLILQPHHPDTAYREVLVLVRPNELKEKWDGKRLTIEQAKEISGIHTIVWLDTLPGLLPSWIHHAEIIYLNSNENDKAALTVQTRDYRYAKQLKEKYPLHQYRRSAGILKKLRSIKNAHEVEVVQQAISITHETFLEVMKTMKPGIGEWEIEATIVYNFLKRRASGEAYSSIIASGDNARILHYIKNNQVCENGELVLMDFGARYGGYCADLTRTIPVNGKFTARQKEVYNACLYLLNAAKQLLQPGITLDEYTRRMGELATEIFVKIGLLTAEQAKDPQAYRKYLYHGISHHLGIDVHDLNDRSAALVPGMLLTVEPGIYIEEEKMGIRIENNILITADGNIDLMQEIPITVEEIEAFMAR
ncbi:aminopeptidase P family protein [Gynurincola endophyticus]|jgi:Xaa-Pro aminopeptidase|uniref:aminopeptidase P family protein n=1 Tax=Gynurincola endophyticus TaxID=2479004 RepID=UPI000F8D844E|nr:aminopeptidase P family protein [Gynurincola endophyticus]